MQMINEKAIEIIEKMAPETDKEMAALRLAIEALKVYKQFMLYPDGNSFKMYNPEFSIEIACHSKEEQDKVIAYLEDYEKKETDGQGQD